QRLMHTLPKRHLHLLQLGEESRPDSFTQHEELPILPGFSADVRLSSPGESHPEALAEPDVNLSAHPAPIKQTCRSYQGASVRRDPVAPRQAVARTGSPGSCDR